MKDGSGESRREKVGESRRKSKAIEKMSKIKEPNLKIKICGLSREEDIVAVNQALPDYCGFIIDFPKSHRNVTREQVQVLTKNLDHRISRVGVVVNQPLDRVAALLTENVVDIVQLHGNEDEAYLNELRNKVRTCLEKLCLDKEYLEKSSLEKLCLDKEYLEKSSLEKPSLDEECLEKTRLEKPWLDEECLEKTSLEKSCLDESNLEKSCLEKPCLDKKKAGCFEIWQAFKISDEKDLERAMTSSADKIILDNGYGTGKTFDWSFLEQESVGALLRESNRPWFLAGGLTVENISEAISRLHPFGIDISSGVETRKKKDADKIRQAVAAVREKRETQTKSDKR